LIGILALHFIFYPWRKNFIIRAFPRMPRKLTGVFQSKIYPRWEMIYP